MHEFAPGMTVPDIRIANEICFIIRMCIGVFIYILKNRFREGARVSSPQDQSGWASRKPIDSAQCTGIEKISNP